MSTPTGIQSNLVPFALSTDNSTYKNVVCKKAWGFKGTTPTNVEETDCGPMVGLGSNNFSFDFQMVLNTTPNGATEMSAKDVLTIWNNQTACYVKVQYPGGVGTDFYLQASGYITSFELTNQVGNLMTFSGTFTGNGTVDITP
jgi:hypothetical protein